MSNKPTPANRLTNAGDVAYTWDARRDLTHDGVFTYTYNAAGRLVQAESVTSTLVYTYTSASLSAGTTGGLRVHQGADEDGWVTKAWLFDPLAAKPKRESPHEPPLDTPAHLLYTTMHTTKAGPTDKNVRHPHEDERRRRQNMSCYIHPSIAAVTTCAQCNREICADCTTTVMGVTYCIRCAPAVALPQRQGAGTGLTIAITSGLIIFPLILAGIIIVTAVVVIIILALLGPAIGNIFSNITGNI